VLPLLVSECHRSDPCNLRTPQELAHARINHKLLACKRDSSGIDAMLVQARQQGATKALLGMKQRDPTGFAEAVTDFLEKAPAGGRGVTRAKWDSVTFLKKQSKGHRIEKGGRHKLMAKPSYLNHFVNIEPPCVT
jgi:hypothetical protein